MLCIVWATLCISVALRQASSIAVTEPEVPKSSEKMSLGTESNRRSRLISTDYAGKFYEYARMLPQRIRSARVKGPRKTCRRLHHWI